jgi:hypothetical protein
MNDETTRRPLCRHAPEVDAAALPGCGEDPADGGLDALVCAGSDSFTLRGSRRAASEESFLDAGTAARSLPSRQRARVLARSLALARFTTWLAGRSAPKLWPGMIWRPWR